MFSPSLLHYVDLTRLAGLSVSLSRGVVTVEMAREDIEYAMLQFAREAARSKAVEIESIELTFEPDSASSLKFRALVTARKILFTARVRITGRILVNDVLQAILTDLRATGEGMMGDLGALAVQPELEKYCDRPFPLTPPASFPLHLSDVRLEAGPPLRISAAVRQP